MEKSMCALKQDRQRGFTLIEMMIVVAIVAILASVAIPNYSEYVQRSNRGEAVATMLEASNWLQRGYTINNTYVGATTATLQTAGLGTSPKTGTAKYNLALSNVSATSYTLTATAVNTDKCANFTLDETGKRSVSGSAPLADCWGGR